MDNPMVKVIEIIDDSDSDDEELVIFDQTPFGMRVLEETPEAQEAMFIIKRHRWRDW